ncbi:MAG: sialidase family protein [Spirosomataceae bacterium]
MFRKITLSVISSLLMACGFQSLAQPVLDASDKAYSMPLLTQTPKGDVLLSWTEKDAAGITSFCLAISKDNGATFSDKKTIFSGNGIGNSRLMRAKVLVRKDGSLVAVFSNRLEAAGGKRASDIVYCISTDQGATWTAPKSVDTDPTKCTRGFFDAVVLPNDEIAVAYLKDVAGSTKFEERDLRLVLTKNGVFQPERVIDPVVCDCCNISLLVDAKGALNVYYRDNNDNIRDMAKMTSTDNGITFSAPQILHNDGWKINGCPHSGATSSVYGKSALISWFSGTTNEPGIRLVTEEGKKLLVLEAAAKNSFLTSSSTASVLLWEQVNPESNTSQIALRKVKGDNVSATEWVKESLNGANAAAIVANEQLLVAYEVKQPSGKNTLKVSTLKL